MPNPLDNPVWHALRGRQARFAEAAPAGGALRFEPEVSIFGAVESLDATSWEGLAELAGPGGAVFLFRDQVKAPPVGWTEVYRAPTLQMVAGELAVPDETPIEELGKGDVEEMLALTRLTEPGPFLSRTHELGTYVGVRRNGRLVAMAGERFQPPGWTEISAVCTHPEVRREGLAAALTLFVANRIRARGDEAFLHLVETNVDAMRLYESIGFTTRRTVDVVAAVRDEIP